MGLGGGGRGVGRGNRGWELVEELKVGGGRGGGGLGRGDRGWGWGEEVGE